MTTSTREGAKTPAAIAREVFDAVIAHDPDAIVQFAAPDEHVDFVAVKEYHGPDEVRRFFVEVFAAFPDFAMTVDRIVADDRIAVVQWHITGTFTAGPFLGLLPTGRRVALKGVDVMEIEAGLIRRNTIYYDGATMARQIGLLPKKDGLGDRALLGVFNVRTRAARLVRRRPQAGLSH